MRTSAQQSLQLIIFASLRDWAAGSRCADPSDLELPGSHPQPSKISIAGCNPLDLVTFKRYLHPQRARERRVSCNILRLTCHKGPIESNRSTSHASTMATPRNTDQQREQNEGATQEPGAYSSRNHLARTTHFMNHDSGYTP